jgi:putative endonuclease
LKVRADGKEAGDMKDHEYFVYIVCSLSGTIYIGMTNSIYRRALQHKRGEIEGFGSKYHCDRLVYYESFDDVYKAIGREKQLKGWSRANKIVLIESKNARWEDMAEKWGAEMLFAGESIHKLSSFYENRRTCPQVFLRRCGQASIRARGA